MMHSFDAHRGAYLRNPLHVILKCLLFGYLNPPEPLATLNFEENCRFICQNHSSS